VARALAFSARVVVMDEPTSSLSRRETERLFAVIERLHERDVAVIYISHFLEEIQRVAQRYTVLRDGRSVATGTVRPASADDGLARELLQAMAGRSLAETFPRIPHEPAGAILSLDGLSGAALPERASLTLHRGEILGLFGLVGAGRSELLRSVFGLAPVREGKITVGALSDAGRPPHARLAQGVGLLSEDRKDEGLALGMSIADNATLSKPLTRLGLLDAPARLAAVTTLARRLSLKYRDAAQPAAALSGGNQQKVALMRLLHHDVDVLLLDEPTRGIDVGSKAEIYRLMGELAQQGKALLFVSSYLPELLGVCDRIGVMSRGRLSELRPRSDWSEATILEEATRG
jgi:ribose transport system ATP-binding protein